MHEGLFLVPRFVLSSSLVWFLSPHPSFPLFFTFLSLFSNLSHILPLSYIPSFILAPPHPPHRLLCSCSGVWRAASFSKLRWISCHGDQTQITNNGMLIMVITVWRLLQENEQSHFFFVRITEGKCQRWGALDNIILNRASGSVRRRPTRRPGCFGAKTEAPHVSQLALAPRRWQEKPAKRLAKKFSHE